MIFLSTPKTAQGIIISTKTELSSFHLGFLPPFFSCDTTANSFRIFFPQKVHFLKI